MDLSRKSSGVFVVVLMCGYIPCSTVCVYCMVRYMSLSLALRYVLESLKKPPTTKMYLFGLAALDKFKSRLKEFPQYCASIATIPHYQQFPMHLKQVS